MIKRCYLLLFLYTIISTANAQDFKQSKAYPKDIFRYPLDLAPATAGGFGELRPNHFHAGLDFKTMQRIGYPVHAAEKGYVSRIKVQYGGFGNAVYIAHPGGYTSVYGHLDHFSPELAALIQQAQAQQQKWDVDLMLTPFQVPVYKGQVVAASGNTGASGGPHVHFEIRDTETQETINAQLFGLTIPDKVPPSLFSVSVYHLNGRPFDENTLRQTYPVRGAAGSYHLLKPQTLELSGEVGFGITANDMNSSSANKNGVYSIELNVDGKTVFTYAAERFAFDQTHAINAFIDYPFIQKAGGFIQKCFILPGAKITLYPQSVNRGVVTFNDNETHDVEYVVKDIAGNASTVKLKVKSSIPKDKPVFRPQGFVLHYDKHSEFVNDKVKLVSDPGNLYDDLDLQYSILPKHPGSYSEVHHIHNKYTPIHDSLILYIKPDANLGKYTDKAVLVSSINGAVESSYENGFVKGIIHGFGDYDIRIDSVPPVITPVNIRSGSSLSATRSIIFRVGDSLAGVKNVIGKIDGKWVLVVHDYKSKMFIYTFGPEISTGKHTFELTAIDFKNNVSQFTADFNR
jgi:murein DD-endopeptidase MepM/ murein hydrolase activator NlpD